MRTSPRPRREKSNEDDSATAATAASLGNRNLVGVLSTGLMATSAMTDPYLGRIASPCSPPSAEAAALSSGPLPKTQRTS